MSKSNAATFYFLSVLRQHLSELIRPSVWRFAQPSWRSCIAAVSLSVIISFHGFALIVSNQDAALVKASVSHAAAMPAEEPNAVRSETPMAPAADAARILAGEIQLGAYAGTSNTHASDVTVIRRDGEQTSLEAVRWYEESFRNPIYYGLRIVGWPRGIPVGGMVDYLHAKAVSDPTQQVMIRHRAADGTETNTQGPLGQAFPKLEFSHGHNLLLLTGLYRLPFGSARVSPYLGLGAGGSVPHVEVQEAGQAERTYEYQLSGFAAQGLFGLELRLARTSLFIEYKMTFAPYRPDLKDKKGGHLATDLLTHHLVSGLTLRLPRRGG